MDPTPKQQNPKIIIKNQISIKFYSDKSEIVIFFYRDESLSSRGEAVLSQGADQQQSVEWIQLLLRGLGF